MEGAILVSEDRLIWQRPGIIAAESGGEMVVLDPDRGEFLELSTTAARIWSMLEQPVTMPQLCQQMATMFDVDADSCRGDVAAFVAALADRRLIETASPDSRSLP
jgi:hypothetical protein